MTDEWHKREYTLFQELEVKKRLVTKLNREQSVIGDDKRNASKIATLRKEIIAIKAELEQISK